jgi:hypothetical protein
MNEQTKTQIEHSREINRLQRSIDNLNRSLEISNTSVEIYENLIVQMADKIKELQSQIELK